MGLIAFLKRDTPIMITKTIFSQVKLNYLQSYKIHIFKIKWGN